MHRFLVRGFVAATVPSVVLLAASQAPAHAKGPSNIAVAFQLANDGVIPVSVGDYVALRIDLLIDPSGAAPSDSALSELTTTTRSSGLEMTRGPQHPLGGGRSPSAIGARSGQLSISAQTNIVAALGDTSFVSDASSSHFGAIAQCGDNYGGSVTRSYVVGDAAANQQRAIGPLTSTLFVGDMSGKDDVVGPPEGVFGWDGTAAELLYAHTGGELIQTYDDDNDDGLPDLAGSTIGEPLADDASTKAHPFATAGGGALYTPGAPETQHDSDADGLPDGLEFMPDFLPAFVEALGLRPYWEGRHYGIVDPWPGVIPPLDVHVIGLTDVPGVGALFMTLPLTNPFVPTSSSGHFLVCPPFALSTAFDIATSVVSLCPNSACPAPAPAVTGGDPVVIVSRIGTNSISTALSDEDDYDNDGFVGGVELCARSAINDDPDGDLVAGACDVNPSSWDNDGDGDATIADRALSIESLIDQSAACTAGGGVCDNDHDDDRTIENVDNCENVYNPDQGDVDGDGVGDVCDPFDTIDTISGKPAGKGDGPGGFSNTSENLDNDLTCTRTWSTGGTLPLGFAICNATPDSNDDGIPDVASLYTDEDGDGFSDACEVNSSPAKNPLDPISAPAVPAGLLANSAGAATSTDADADHLLDGCETSLGVISIDPADPDTDDDLVQDGVEYGAGTNPLVANTQYFGSPSSDTDGDGCTNLKEISAADSPIGGDQANPGFDRHPGNWWDFYSVDEDGVAGYNPNNNVDLSDTIDILGHFGEGYNGGAYETIEGQGYDRTRLLNPGPPGLLVEGNNGIDIAEVLANLYQFGFGGSGCIPPGPVPPEGGGVFD